jgi:hypothetical protein
VQRDIKFISGINKFICGCFCSQAVPAHPSGKGCIGARNMLRSKEEGFRNWNVIKHQRKDVGRSGQNDQHVMTRFSRDEHVVPKRRSR